MFLFLFIVHDMVHFYGPNSSEFEIKTVLKRGEAVLLLQSFG